MEPHIHPLQWLPELILKVQEAIPGFYSLLLNEALTPEKIVLKKAQQDWTGSRLFLFPKVLAPLKC